MRGATRGQCNNTGGAWLVTREAGGGATREPLLTFDPFGLARGRTHHRPLGHPRYAAWKREALRFRRAMAGVARRRIAAQARALSLDPVASGQGGVGGGG